MWCVLFSSIRVAVTQLTRGLAPHTIIHKYFAKSTNDALLHDHTLLLLLPWASRERE